MTIHDAAVEVTCDYDSCDQSIMLPLPFVYADIGGGGGRYDHDPRRINRAAKRMDWIISDDGDKHYCCKEHAAKP